MNKHNIITYLLKIFFAITSCISISLLFIINAVDIVCYHIPCLFRYEYQKYSSDIVIGISMDNLLTVTKQMMNYLKDYNDNLYSIRTTIDNTPNVLFFNEREVLHMKDVKNLFLQGLHLEHLLIILLPVLVLLYFLLAFYLGKNMSKYSGINILKYGINLINKSLLKALLIFNSIIVILGFIISLNFEKYFIIFHKIFFNNDLWLLDPRTDRLINIVPEGFFMDLSLYIISFYIAFQIIFIIFLLLLNKNIRPSKYNKF